MLFVVTFLIVAAIVFLGGRLLDGFASHMGNPNPGSAAATACWAVVIGLIGGLVVTGLATVLGQLFGRG